MLQGIFKHRPSSLCVIYIEPRRIEIVRAQRRLRKWEVETAEHLQAPAGENVFDYLQHQNIRPKGKKGSALLLVLSVAYYSVHREHYPLSLKDHLEEAINFDWQENLFHEHDRTLHFFGPPVPLNHYISVPIFSIQMEIYDKLHQSVNASLFQTFAVMPSGISFGEFRTPAQSEDALEVFARILDDSQLEVHRFYKGAYLDSTMLGKSFQSLELFRETLRNFGNGNGGEEEAPRMHLICLPDECGGDDDYLAELTGEGLPVEIHRLGESFVTGWVRRLVDRDAIYTFDAELVLKPWKIPRIMWPIVAAVVCFAIYGLYQVRSTEQLTLASKRLRVQVGQLETQWKPIEELQTRITKFREDQKTLSEFNREGYPLLELLTFLTQLTPEDTWLNYISLRKGQLILRGESKSAIKFLSELSKTEGMSDVKFASPVTRNPASDQERFNVQVQLDMEKLRKSFEGLPEEPLEEAAKPQATPVVQKSAPEVKRKPPPMPAPPDDEEIDDSIMPEEGPFVDEGPPPDEEEAQ